MHNKCIYFSTRIHPHSLASRQELRVRERSNSVSALTQVLHTRNKYKTRNRLQLAQKQKVARAKEVFPFLYTSCHPAIECTLHNITTYASLILHLSLSLVFVSISAAPSTYAANFPFHKASCIIRYGVQQCAHYSRNCQVHCIHKSKARRLAHLRHSFFIAYLFLCNAPKDYRGIAYVSHQVRSMSFRSSTLHAVYVN